MRRFRKTYVEITNVCDLACDFCRPTSRPPRFMDRQLFADILAQMRDIAGLLHFHVMGEPLLHPEVGVFLDLCHESGHRVNLITNGRCLPRLREVFAHKPALRQVSVSAHSLVGTAAAPALDAHFGDIADIVRAAGPSAPALSLRMWTMVPGIVDERYAGILRAIEEAFEVRTSLADALRKARSVQIAPFVYINCASRFEWPDLDSTECGAQGHCLGLRDQCAILSDGTVVPCCLDRNGTIALGNVRERPVTEILAGDRACAIREGFARGEVVEELCRKCSYRLRFSGRGSEPPTPLAP
jgi:radical SAM protein with 4Fe4S-binding SPASM domain